jgi:hypothetical protein
MKDERLLDHREMRRPDYAFRTRSVAPSRMRYMQLATRHGTECGGKLVPQIGFG